MSRNLTPFERHLKSTMDSHEMPVRHSDWVDFENKIGVGKSDKSSWLVAAVASALVIAASGFMTYNYVFKGSVAIKASSEGRFNNNSSIISQRNTANPNESIDSSGNLSKNPNQNLVVASADNQKTSSIISKNNTSSSGLIDSAANFNHNSSGLNNSATQVDSNPATNAVLPKAKGENSYDFAPSISNACAGTEVEFVLTDGPKEASNKRSYLWNFGDGNFSAEQNPRHIYTKPGVYDISLSITSEKGQINTVMHDDVVTINPAPTADFEYEFVNGPDQSPTVKVVNTSNNASSFEWKFSNGSTSNQISPIVNLQDKGTELIALNVVNQFGCSSKKGKHVYVNTSYNINAQKAFSPARETFMPEGVLKSKFSFKMRLFSESGQKVFETNSKSKAWDGKLPDGSVAAAGESYTWIVIMETEDGEEKYFNGIVNITP
jgi:PKD repeat protein